MDSLTQMVLGGAVGYAIMGKKLGKKAAVYGAALGTVPDLDVFIPYSGPIEEFTYHRSASHSLVIHLIVSPIFAWLAKKLFVAKGISMTRWFWMIFAVFSTHALLDSFTVYGTQLLWPISEYPFGFSNLFIIDPIYSLPLLIGFIASLLFKPGQATRFVNGALLITSVYIVWSFGAKFYVDHQNRLAFAKQGISPQAYVSTPAPFTTLLWRSVAVENNQYHEVFTSVFDSVEDVSIATYQQNTELLKTIEHEWEIKRLSWFTKGLYSAFESDQNILVSDLRMGIQGSYVFTFKVAERNGETIVSSNIEHLPSRPEIDDMSLIWKRIFDPSVSLTPDARAKN